jgi:putative cardiolipin synthase
MSTPLKSHLRFGIWFAVLKGMKNLIIATLLLLSSSALWANSLLQNFKSPFLVQNQQGNQVQVSNSGIASLQLRLDLIKKAQKSIEVEYFIYNLDRAGRIFTHALMEAAQRGVKVRVLVDKSLPVFKLKRHFVHVLKDKGIDVRYYNNASALQFSTSQFRSHRKLFVIDDEIAITGGRNLADEYFDLSTEFNFLDRDILVQGPMVKVMRDSFDAYWNNKLSITPKRLNKPVKPIPFTPADEFLDPDYKEELSQYEDELYSYEKKIKEAHAFITPTEQDRELLEKMESVARPILNDKKTYECPNLTYAADLPGARSSQRIRKDFTDRYRVLRKVLAQEVLKSKESVLISSPYFIHNIKARGLLNEMLDRDLKVTFYTNSLGSTDAIYVASNFYRSVFSWEREGIIPYIHPGVWLNETEVIDEGVKKAKWGTHSKSHVYDDDTIMIGTYNVDTRSNFYNAEMAIFCRGNKDLAQEVKESISYRMTSGYKIIGKNKAINSMGERVDVLGEAGFGSKVMMMLLAVPSWIFSFLL